MRCCRELSSVSSTLNFLSTSICDSPLTVEVAELVSKKSAQSAAVRSSVAVFASACVSSTYTTVVMSARCGCVSSSLCTVDTGTV
jgi:hypothetical protein